MRTPSPHSSIRSALALAFLLSACSVESSKDHRRSDLGTPADGPLAASREFVSTDQESGVVYFVLTDRFVNGSVENDVHDECFDSREPNLFHGGDLEGLRSRLDYLQELGVTDVWISPVQRQVGPEAVPPVLGRQCAFHGYWAALDLPDDGALEPRFGGEKALRALLDEMHTRGMRLIVDYVVNHPGYGAPLVAKRPDWFHPEPGCEKSGVPEETCALLHLPDLAQERPEVSAYLNDVTERFLRRFPIDGIRMDTVKHVPLSYFRDGWIPSVRRTSPGLFLLGELFDESGYAPQRQYLDAGFDSLFDFNLRRALVDTYGRGESLNRVAESVASAVRELGPERARLRVTLVDNHDVPRFISEMREEPSHIKSERYWLALGTLFTTPGIPQLNYANELGMQGFWPENRRDMPAWAFDASARTPREGYLGNPARNFDVVRQLSRTRQATPALRHGDYVELWRPGGLPASVYAFLRTHEGSRALVVFHAGDEPLDAFSIPVHLNAGVPERDRVALADGTQLRDVLGLWTAAEGRIQDGNLVVRMPPRSMAVFVGEGEQLAR